MNFAKILRTPDDCFWKTSYLNWDVERLFVAGVSFPIQYIKRSLETSFSWVCKINLQRSVISRQMINHKPLYSLFFPRLVIFPMSGNNTFETPDFADLRFSFWSSEGTSLSPTVFLLQNMKQMFLCSLPKEFVCSRFFTVEKSKSI